MEEIVWVTEAKYMEGYKIFLRFNNGIEGLVDLEDILTGPVFQPLKDKNTFKNFQLNSWTLEWPNGADLAPEYLYNQILRNQTPAKTG